MALTVVTPATNTDLTTLANVRATLGITDTSQDALLQLLISQASDAIVTHCHRHFAQETYTETLAGFDTNYLMTSRRPLVSVSQITFNGGLLDPSTYNIEDANAGLIFGNVPFFWTTELAVGIALEVQQNSELRRYSVSYVAGWNLPGDSTQTLPLPRDIERACIDTVKTWYREAARDPYVVQKAVGDLKLQYALPDTLLGLSPLAEKLLERYVTDVGDQ